MVKRTRSGRGLRRTTAIGGALVVGAALAVLPTTSALATNGTAVVVACPGQLTWTFSAPLTLGFVPSATVRQTWSFASVCVAQGADVSTQVQVPPPDDEFTEVFASPETGTASFSGSCVVANAGISSYGVTGETGLLVGGTVVVSPPFNDVPGEELSEVDVLATTNPCNESSATGEGNDVAWYIATS
jgi:hypothetical protein